MDSNWTVEELEIIKQNAEENDFIGLNYYQPIRVERYDMDIKSEEHSRENSTLAPGNPSFDGFIEQLKWMIKHIQNGDGKYLPKVS